MSFHSKFATTCAAVLLSTTGVFAQVGGSDVPSDAKAQGAKENGGSSVGKPEMQGDAMKKSGSMEKSGGSMMKKDDKK